MNVVAIARPGGANRRLAAVAASILLAATACAGSDPRAGVVADPISIDSSTTTPEVPGTTTGAPPAVAETSAPATVDEPASATAPDATPPVTPSATPSATPPVTTAAPSAEAAPGDADEGFVDDFDGASLDDDRWVAVERDSDVSNDEQGCYLADNVTVADGLLHIGTQSDPEGCRSIDVDQDYSSGMVQWRSFAFTYGRLEVRAKVSGGRGPWPAIWLLGTDCQANNPIDANDFACNWPQPGSDEIDVAEFLDGDFSQVNHQIHSEDSHPGCRSEVPDPVDDWHVYALEWSPDELSFEVDGDVTCVLDEAVPSTAKFLLINTAVGGVGGGDIEPSSMPADLWIDYVRVQPAG
jgi:beta-glucanase (GH16 family)